MVVHRLDLRVPAALLVLWLLRLLRLLRPLARRL
jgi:hypothetical protein